MKDLTSIAARRQTITRLIPILNAIRSIAEIAWRRAEEGFQPLNQYREQIGQALGHALTSVDEGHRQPLLGGWSAGKPYGLLLVTSERGLCGPFNRLVVQAAIEEEKKLSSQGHKVSFLCLGSRGRRALEASGYALDYARPLPSFSVPSYVSIEEVALDLLDLMERQVWGQLFVIHHAPARRFQYGISRVKLFPPSIQTYGRRSRRVTTRPSGDEPALLNHLLTEYLMVGLYTATLESVISEQLARIYTMRLAVENAQRLLDELTLQFNLARRNATTTSLLELVTGYGAALDNSDRLDNLPHSSEDVCSSD